MRRDARLMRLVLDTNVVLDLVVFRDPGAATLRGAILARRVVLLTSLGCLAELRRVLAYPEFKRDEGEQEDAYEWYASRAEVAAAPAPEPLLPRCRDADDQKFLELAWAGDADHLVTKDKALLDLAWRLRKLGKFAVTPPSDLASRLQP